VKTSGLTWRHMITPPTQRSVDRQLNLLCGYVPSSVGWISCKSGLREYSCSSVDFRFI